MAERRCVGHLRKAFAAHWTKSFVLAPLRTRRAVFDSRPRNRLQIRMQARQIIRIHSPDLDFGDVGGGVVPYRPIHENILEHGCGRANLVRCRSGGFCCDGPVHGRPCRPIGAVINGIPLSPRRIDERFFDITAVGKFIRETDGAIVSVADAGKHLIRSENAVEQGRGRARISPGHVVVADDCPVALIKLNVGPLGHHMRNARNPTVHAQLLEVFAGAGFEDVFDIEGAELGPIDVGAGGRPDVLRAGDGFPRRAVVRRVEGHPGRPAVDDFDRIDENSRLFGRDDRREIQHEATAFLGHGNAGRVVRIERRVERRRIGGDVPELVVVSREVFGRKQDRRPHRAGGTGQRAESEDGEKSSFHGGRAAGGLSFSLRRPNFTKTPRGMSSRFRLPGRGAVC